MQQENAAVSPDVAQKAQAVENALVQLGADADPKRLAEVVKTQTGLDMDPGEVAAIRAGLASQEPPPDTQQPPLVRRGHLKSDLVKLPSPSNRQRKE